MSYLNDEGKYQTDITNLEWFFIYYNGKRYIYNNNYKSLKDSSDKKIVSNTVDDVFKQQMNQIIHKTLNPPKTIDVF